MRDSPKSLSTTFNDFRIQLTIIPLYRNSMSSSCALVMYTLWATTISRKRLQASIKTIVEPTILSELSIIN